MDELKCPHCGKVFQIDESGYEAIARQVRGAEVDREVKVRIELERARAQNEREQELRAHELAMQELRARLESFETDKRLAVTEAVSEKKDELGERDRRIGELQTQLAETRRSMQEQYDAMIKNKDAEIQRLADYRARMSTKMLGESLERHCEIEFERLRALGFRSASFGKDNDARTGSKGDYIFRDFDADGTEYISIMFEMKNEMETTATKKKNEDFLKELDKDRREKGCEYAVLVSMLDADSELYNTGIVDVSHIYDKMYVVRPQFFVPIITILRNAAMNSAKYRRELAEVKNRNVDVTNFEERLGKFVDGIRTSYERAGSFYQKAIENIDKTIRDLEKTKKDLQDSLDQMRRASDRAEDLTIKKLTRGNATMKELFAALPKKDDILQD